MNIKLKHVMPAIFERLPQNFPVPLFNEVMKVQKILESEVEDFTLDQRACEPEGSFTFELEINFADCSTLFLISMPYSVKVLYYKCVNYSSCNNSDHCARLETTAKSLIPLFLEEIAEQFK